jgi:hypothetical protein
MTEAYAVQASFDDWLRLIRAEYFEVRGLHLTKKQAEQLWGLDTLTCEALLDALVNARFLRRTKAGAYTRIGSGG